MQRAHDEFKHGHVPSNKVQPLRHFVQLPYSGESHSSQEYSKHLLLFSHIIILFEILNKILKTINLQIFFSFIKFNSF